MFPYLNAGQVRFPESSLSISSISAGVNLKSNISKFALIFFSELDFGIGIVPIST